MNSGKTQSSGVGNYASVNGLEMYYEIHGSGSPLVLLHGGITTIDTSFGVVLPTLAETWQVIAIEQQGHGHTADIDRPMSYEEMAEDTAALLRQIGVKKADFFGYSDGGIVSLGVAIRYPELVRKLALGGTNFNNDGLYPGFLEMFQHADAEDESMGFLRDVYTNVAPRPQDWPTLIAKVSKMALDFKGWSREDLERIDAHTLVIVGDADIVRPEHAVELFRLIPHAQLAVLPNTDHFLRLMTPEWVLSMLIDFFNAPLPEAK